jgi:diacylglycerol O-acyltransferase
MDRMSMLDAEFLYIEDGCVQLHIGSCAVFEGPPPSFEEFAAMTESKLPRVPRYRHVVRDVPLGLGRPVWVDDPHFNLEYHLRHTALPSPGGDDQLRRLTSRIMGQTLDRRRPLWESWMVEGLDGGRWAVITKVHHAMVDGVSGAEMMNVLLDLEPDAPLAAPEPWQPESPPSEAELVLDAVGGFLGQLRHMGGAFGSVLVHPRRLFSVLHDDREALVESSKSFEGRQTGSLGGTIGPHRRWDWAEGSLDEIKAIKTALGGTVNDVVLAAITSGFRALLEARGEVVEGLTMRTLVPVSVRGEDQHGQFNNKVSGLIAELPIGMDDAGDRLRFISEQMRTLKASHGAELGEAATTLGDLVLPGMLAIGSRLTMRLMERLPKLSIGTVTTNVPGPQFPLYAMGRRLVAYYPFVPIAHGAPVGVAILSYDGKVAFGLTGDYEALPDLRVLARGIEVGLEELAELAAVKSSAPEVAAVGPA